jgi:hypothetical protein
MLLFDVLLHFLFFSPNAFLIYNHLTDFLDEEATNITALFTRIMMLNWLHAD